VDQADLEEARRLMQLEYETAIESIANFDDQRARIKGWTIAGAGALLALAVNSHNWSPGMIAAAAVLFFAYIDIAYMAAQQKIIDRSHELEAYTEAGRRGDFAKVNEYIFGIGEAHDRKYSLQEVLGILGGRPQIVVFYVGLALGTGVVTLLLALAGERA
jgi:hypothetical protein